MSANPSSASSRWRTPAAPTLNPRPRRPSALLAVSFLAGCSLWPGRDVAGLSGPFAPLAPSTYGGSARAEQILTLSAGDRSTTLQAYVAVTPSKISVVGTTALAQRVLSFTEDDAGLHVEAAEGGIDPQRVLTDLQLANWPLAALQKAVAGSEWRISDPQPGLRRVLRGNEPFAEVHYSGKAPPWDGRVWLVNFPLRYTLDIDSHPLQ